MSERTNERVRGAEASSAERSESVSGASECANGGANGPAVFTRRFLTHSTHSGRGVTYLVFYVNEPLGILDRVDVSAQNAVIDQLGFMRLRNETDSTQHDLAT